LTGGKALAEELGVQLEDVTLADLGRAQRVIVGRDRTTLIGGGGAKDAISSRVSQLRQQLERTDGQYDRDKLQQRLAKLAGGVAILRLGAATEPELKE
jgi:chaperonin GroEL